MALVDALLKLLPAQRADGIVIPASESPWLEQRGVVKPLSMPALGRETVEAMAAELFDPRERETSAAGHTVEARYKGQTGQIYIALLEPHATGPRLTIRLADEHTAAISSPATMPRPTATASVPSPQPRETPPRSAELADDSRLEPLRVEPVLDPGSLIAVFDRATREGASDILFSSGSHTRLRVGGEILELPGSEVGETDLRAFIEPALGVREGGELRETGSIDLAIRVHVDGRIQRYRANLFLQRSGHALVLRTIRATPPNLDTLHLPAELAELATLRNGLVLMTGAAGSGKSTTLVALIEHLNRTAPKHIITLEDPIEYEYQHRRALVHQRQIGIHVRSFSEGLRAALRESPDVILVGEMRDHATMAAALTAAETGHLVLSTLHAADAAMALDRIVDSFPEHQQAQVRVQVAGTLRAIVTQRLLPSRTPPLRVPALELLRVNTAVATKIREGRMHQIQSEIQKGRADGMMSFELTLAALVRRGLIGTDAAMAHASDPTSMTEHLRRGS